MIWPHITVLLSVAILSGCCRTGETGKVKPLADDFVTVYHSPDPTNLFCFSPGICRLGTGRLIATFDLSGNQMKGNTQTGRAFLSDDRGKTWRQTGSFPLRHARPFEAGGRLYVLGHNGDLGIVASPDGGETWGEVSRLTDGERWHQSACNVWRAKGNVYLVMERYTPRAKVPCIWGVSCIVPVLMRAREDSDLTRRESWTFADSFDFRSIFNGDMNHEFDYFGIPWYSPVTSLGVKTKKELREKYGDTKPYASPVGWLETNVVQIMDPNHVWYDPSGNTFHLFMRANTGGSGYAAMAKVVEQPDGTMKTLLERAPSGVPMLFLPFPGGQMRFHVLWDEKTGLYWLLSTQATDTLVRHDRMPKGRYNLPYDERQRLQLSFSRNMVDWCFAGLVSAGKTVLESRSYASMAIDGDDLVILSRSGDERAVSPHNTDIITFHRVANFRSLVY